MDEDLILLKDMADVTPLPSHRDLAPARARLRAEFTAGPPKRRRLLFAGIAVAGLAAAVAGVVALGGLNGETPERHTAANNAPPTVTAGAADILRLAATTLRDQPATPPRPDQFVYTKTQTGSGQVREVWLSVDGTRDGIVRQYGGDIPLPGCVDGQAAVIKGDEPIPGAFEPCTASPAYRADLPTDAAGMRAYLESLGGEDNINSFGKNIHYLFAETYVSPQSQAALFDMIATVDGLEVVQDAKDGAGRAGVGVRWSHEGFDMTLVFDAQTHDFIGISGSDAVVAQAIVDTAGQQP
jgi:hypothetical protein